MNDRLKFLAPPAVALLLGGFFGFQSGGDSNEILFMDVGQGDCTAIVSHGATVLVDVGPKTPTYDSGERIVVPQLRRYGLRPNMILLTHPDTDHVGGLSAVVRAFPDVQVLINAEFRTSKHMIDQLREAKVPENRVRWLPPHLEMQVGDYSAELFCPPWRVGENDNEGSVVMRIWHGSASAVLMGDAGFKVEYSLLGAREWRSQILKVGHHGSRNSTSAEWLNAVKPTWAVVSCGLNNRYGHPHRMVLDRLKAASALPVRTDEQGDIWFLETESGFQLVHP